MGLFDNVGKKISESSQSVINKAKEMSEIASVKSQISAEEKVITNCFQQIGEQCFEKYGEDENSEFASFFMQIKEAKEKIVKYNDEILKIKNISLCPSCGAECANGVKFCSSCGAKLPEIVVEEEAAPAPGKKFCISCHAELDEDAQFCTSCGSAQPVENQEQDNEE